MTTATETTTIPVYDADPEIDFAPLAPCITLPRHALYHYEKLPPRDNPNGYSYNRMDDGYRIQAYAPGAVAPVLTLYVAPLERWDDSYSRRSPRGRFVEDEDRTIAALAAAVEQARQTITEWNV